MDLLFSLTLKHKKCTALFNMAEGRVWVWLIMMVPLGTPAALTWTDGVVVLGIALWDPLVGYEGLRLQA